MNLATVLIVLVAALVLFAAARFLPAYFSTEAKAERRRRRSNRPIASRSKHPTVKFSVKTGKDGESDSR